MMTKQSEVSCFMVLALLASVSAFVPGRSGKCGLALSISSSKLAITRRSWFGSAGVASVFIQGLNQEAMATDKFVTFKDENCGFQIDVPAGWEVNEQSLPDRRRIILFIDPADKDEKDKTLLFIAFTPVRDDYTSLSSFGSVDQVRLQRVNCFHM